MGRGCCNTDQGGRNPRGVLHPSHDGLGYAAGSLQRPAPMLPGERGRVCLSPEGETLSPGPFPPALQSCPTPRGSVGLCGALGGGRR